MIKSLIDQIYNASRSFVFSIIYPAPTLFNPRTRNYIGVRAAIDLIPHKDHSRHLLHLDLGGKICEPHIASDIFEITVIKNPQQPSFYDTNIQYIIFIGGNTTCMEILIPEMLECYDKNNNNVCVIGYNPPGVGLSPGRSSFEANCTAPEAIVKHLLDNNIPAKNILIIGHSLGGSFGSHVAVKYRTRIFIDRSMSSISDAAVAKVRRSIPTLLLRNTLGLLLAIFTRIIIKILHLEINVINNVVAINTKNSGSVRIMAAEDDEMMQHCCLVDNLPAAHTECAEKFVLHVDDKHRKSHSAQRHILFSKHTSDKTAAKYLDNFINEFAKHRQQL